MILSYFDHQYKIAMEEVVCDRYSLPSKKCIIILYLLYRLHIRKRDLTWSLNQAQYT